jgi:hypothetical protein
LFRDHEGVSAEGHRYVVAPTGEATTLVVRKAEFLLHFAVDLFGPVSLLGQVHELLFGSPDILVGAQHELPSTVAA